MGVNLLEYDVSIIIPQYNKPDLTIQCVESILEYVVPFHHLEILVVDDGSMMNAVNEVQDKFADAVRVLRSDLNIGFAKICNLGAKEANGKNVVFLNNDTVSRMDWLTPMLHALGTDPSIGAVGAKLLFPNGTIQHAGVVYHPSANFPLYPVHEFYGQAQAFPPVNISRYVVGVTGACLLIERDVFFQLGGFDEEYLLSYEDVDLCLKILESGRKIWYESSAWMFHLESATRHVEHSISTERDIRNVTLLNQKWLNRGLFKLQYQLSPVENEQANHFIFVVQGMEDIQVIYLQVRSILSLMKMGDRILLYDYQKQQAASEYIIHLSRYNEFVDRVEASESIDRDVRNVVEKTLPKNHYQLVFWNKLDKLQSQVNDCRNMNSENLVFVYV